MRIKETTSKNEQVEEIFLGEVGNAEMSLIVEFRESIQEEAKVLLPRRI